MSGFIFLNLWPQNSILGKFGLKKSKMSVLLEIWHTRYLGRADSKFGVRFLKFWPKIHFWTSLGQKGIPYLFSFETLQLLFDIQLVFVLYFKVPLHSFAAFYKQFWKYKVTIFLFYCGYINTYIYKSQKIWPSNF